MISHRPEGMKLAVNDQRCLVPGDHALMRDGKIRVLITAAYVYLHGIDYLVTWMHEGARQSATVSDLELELEDLSPGPIGFLRPEPGQATLR